MLKGKKHDMHTVTIAMLLPVLTSIRKLSASLLPRVIISNKA